VNTRVPKDTHAQVSKVASLKKKHPGVVEPLLTSVGGIVDCALESFEGSEGDPEIIVGRLSTLIDMNHNVLVALGVGHAALDTVVRVAKENGYSGKLTGAGGGGCAFVLLGSVPNQDSENKLIKTLSETHGFDCFTTSVGGEGVRVGGGLG